jgi:uncharacterized protein (DUF983 family)
MFKKGSKLYSVFGNKCPRCHVGKYYEDGNPYNLKKLTKMYDSCSECGQSFRLEPAFYLGASYVSYGLSVGIFLILYPLLAYNYPEAEVGFFFQIIIGVMILCTPIMYKLSRIIWINFFVKYQSSKKNPDLNK